MPLKTVQTNESVTDFINAIENDSRRKDINDLIGLIRQITKKEPKLWGNIIGFGKYTYHRKNSKEALERFNIGVAARKANISLYVTCHLDKEPLVKKLGKCKYGKGCIYINKLTDIDIDVLKKLIVKYKDNHWYS